MYLLTCVVFALLAFYDVFILKRQDRKLFNFLSAISILWLTFHDGFRWGIGTDWINYYEYFNNCTTQFSDSEFEIGYVILNKAIRNLTENYSVFLIIHAIIVYVLLSRTILKYSVNPLFSFFLLYCIMLTYLGMNRQYIALAICLYSIKYVFSREILKFLISVTVAFLFHKSAIMFLIVYFINKEISAKYYLSILIIISGISISGIINSLPLGLFYFLGNDIGSKSEFYMNSDFLQTNSLSIALGILKRSIWLILAFVYGNRIKNKNEYYTLFLNIYFLSTIIYLLFNNTVLQIIVARGIIYFNIAEIFIIPYLISIFKNNASRKIIFLLIIIYGWIIIEKGFNFYKNDLGIDIFRPYNSILTNPTYNAYK